MATEQQQQQQVLESSIEEFELPRTIVGRVLKNALPENTAIQRDARLAFQKAGTVFISYITSTAQLAKPTSHKTMTPEHIYKAIELAEMESILPRVKEAVQAHKDVNKTKRKEIKSKLLLKQTTKQDEMKMDPIMQDEETLVLGESFIESNEALYSNQQTEEQQEEEQQEEEQLDVGSTSSLVDDL